LPVLAACCFVGLTAGCYGFTAGVEEPNLAAQSAQLQSRIEPGTTTRPEVHRLLGTPIFESREWGVELYRSDQTDISTYWLGILMVPIPDWPEVREYRLYPVVVYSTAGVVQGVGAGRYEEHHRGIGVPKSPGGTNADILGFTLAVEACDEPSCIWLMAPADRGATLLRAPPASGRCVINLAKPDNGVEIVLDDKTRLRSNGSNFGWSQSVPAEPWFARITVPRGTHTVRAVPTGSSLSVAGELHQTLDCRGDQLFVVRVARQFLKAGSITGRAQLTGEIQVRESADAIPDEARVILYHGDRSLAPSD